VDFKAGVHPVPVTGKVFGEAELSAHTPRSLRKELLKPSVGGMPLWSTLGLRRTFLL
jgi:hypothetical protein